MIRPVVEYARPVWHTFLPKYLSDNIEIIQKGVSKLCFQVRENPADGKPANVAPETRLIVQNVFC